MTNLLYSTSYLFILQTRNRITTPRPRMSHKIHNKPPLFIRIEISHEGEVESSA